MSRVGKKPILIPEDVEVKIEGQKITIKGSKGELSLGIQPEIKIEMEAQKLLLKPKIETAEGPRPFSEKNGAYGAGKETRAIWGTTRAILTNMLKGVTEGYEKKLEIEGLGYRAQLSGDNLLLYVGFSHPVEIQAPSGIKFSVEKNIITVFGIDKHLVGQIAANIRKVKPPEPYKGKGIRYLGEVIRRKVGKKAATAGKK